MTYNVFGGTLNLKPVGDIWNENFYWFSVHPDKQLTVSKQEKI